MDILGSVLHPALAIEKAAGRLRRQWTRVPDQPITTLINGQVRFEHQRLPFLTLDNQRAMLTNTYDLILCRYLETHLSPGDIVLDAGANVGYISAVAGSYVGPTGEVHGFEPLPECYARLQILAKLNSQIHFFFNNVAVGEEDGMLPISCPTGDARNATLVRGEADTASRQVPVRRLDNYISENIGSPERIKFIKIDVQGFEFPVLKGLKQFFVKTGLRPPIACDMKPWEFPNLGLTLEDFDRYMKSLNYVAYDQVRENTVIDIRTVTDWQAVLFRAA